MLQADNTGKITGSFTIPAKVPAGSKAVAFTGSGGSRGEAVFVGQGTLTVQTLRQVQSVTNWYYDPLAETFTVPHNTQIAGVDLWFVAKSTEVRIQIRETSSGVPSRVILAETVLQPENIIIDGGGHTRALFDAPISLSANTEYALVVLCDDPTTRLAIAEMGKWDKYKGQWVTSQAYSAGVLLSSSNASTWVSHQDKDLAFRLLEAVFEGAEAKILPLGEVSLSGATDVMLLALSETPTAASRVEYSVKFGEQDAVTVAEGQALELATPFTGKAKVTATLQGDTLGSPILYPGTQVLAGKTGLTADYYSRSISANNATKAVIIFDALVPSGSSVIPKIQIDSGEWVDVTLAGTTNQGDGWAEYRFTQTLNSAELVKLKLLLSGNSNARPLIANIRFMALI